MQEKEYKHKHRVYYYETDKMGRVYHSNYLRWMDEARTEFIRAKGLSYKELEDMGTMLPVSEVNIKYLQAVEYDEEVIVKIILEKISKIKVVFKYEFYNFDMKTLFAKAETVSVFTDLNGKIQRMDEEMLLLMGGK